MASAIPSRELLTLLRYSTRPLSKHRPIAVRRCARTVASHTHSHHAEAISILPTNVETQTSDYKENARQLNELKAQLAELHAKIALGGPEKAREKHVQRGKMLPRE